MKVIIAMFYTGMKKIPATRKKLLNFIASDKQEVRTSVRSWTDDTREKSSPLCKVHLLVFLERYNLVI